MPLSFAGWPSIAAGPSLGSRQPDLCSSLIGWPQPRSDLRAELSDFASSRLVAVVAVAAAAEL